MRAVSLFSGVGGLDLGLQRAGVTVEWLAENDEYRRRVLRERFPGTPIFPDVRDVDGIPFAELVHGGFPCQDLSHAGTKRGLGGERSGLFHEFARVVDIVRPRTVLLENVPGLFTSNGGRDFGVVLGRLAELGYGDLAWRTLDSRHFGVPQRRQRVFVLGLRSRARAGGDRAGQILGVGARCPRHPATGVVSARGETPEAPRDRAPRESGRIAFSIVPDKKQAVNIRAVEVTTAPAVSAVTYGKSTDRGVRVVDEATMDVRRLTPRECERLQGFPDDWTLVGDPTDYQRYAAVGDAVTVPVARWLGERLLGDPGPR